MDRIGREKISPQRAQSGTEIDGGGGVQAVGSIVAGLVEAGAVRFRCSRGRWPRSLRRVGSTRPTSGASCSAGGKVVKGVFERLEWGGVGAEEKSGSAGGHSSPRLPTLHEDSSSA